MDEFVSYQFILKTVLFSHCWDKIIKLQREEVLNKPEYDRFVRILHDAKYHDVQKSFVEMATSNRENVDLSLGPEVCCRCKESAIHEYVFHLPKKSSCKVANIFGKAGDCSRTFSISIPGFLGQITNLWQTS